MHNRPNQNFLAYFASTCHYSYLYINPTEFIYFIGLQEFNKNVLYNIEIIDYSFGFFYYICRNLQNR